MGNAQQDQEANVLQDILEDPSYPSLLKVVPEAAQGIVQAQDFLLGAQGLLLWFSWSDNLADPVPDPPGAFGKA